MTKTMEQTLIITVKGRQAAQFGSRSQKVFAGVGGSIGRSEDCDWVLSAAGVSRVHAIIRYLNGLYFIEDTSTNGMLLNGVALVKGDPSSLKDGDCLQIDTFEMGVSLQNQNDALPQTEYPEPEIDLSDLLPVERGAGQRQPVDDLIPREEPLDSGVDLDPLSFLDAPAGGAAVPLPKYASDSASASWNHSPGMEDHFHPPRTAAPAIPALPEDWDMTKGDFNSQASVPVVPVAPIIVSQPRPEPPVSPPPLQQPPGAVSTTTVPPELLDMFQVVAGGLMDVLRTRAEIKINFRLPVTIVQRSENNPLKFAVTPEEAVQKIMAPPNPAFLSGVAALEDAFDDIRCHQMAMLAGVRAGFDALLAHFTPERFEREVDGGGKRSAFSGKGRYWEKYTEHYDSLMKDPDDAFRRLFGDEFARAYEMQLAQLKSARKTAR